MNNLYNIDCMEFMKDIPDKFYDLAIVDPPFGIGIDGQKENKKGRKSDRKGHIQKEWDNSIPDKEYFTELIRVSKNQIIWGANYFVKHLTEGHKGWIIWDKQQRGLTMSDCEVAYSSFDKATRIKTINRVELLKQGTIHPTEKPIVLYKWLLKNYAKEGDKLLDTHSGSGSFRIAAYDMGFELDSCELDKDYCEANEKRFTEHVKLDKMQMKLF